MIPPIRCTFLIFILVLIAMSLWRHNGAAAIAWAYAALLQIEDIRRYMKDNPEES